MDLDRVEPILVRRFRVERDVVYARTSAVGIYEGRIESETMDIAKRVETPAGRARYQWRMGNAGSQILFPDPLPGTPDEVSADFGLVLDIGGISNTADTQAGLKNPNAVTNVANVTVPSPALTVRDAVADRMKVTALVTLEGFDVDPGVAQLRVRTILEGEMRAGDLKKL